MSISLPTMLRPACRPGRLAAAALCGLTMSLTAGACIAAETAEPSATAAALPSNIPWHRDLDAARSASVVSRRPVLVIFTAPWSEASQAIRNKTLTSPETAALLTACYEPVHVDVDADPALPRSLGVSSIPTACIVDADGRLLARFECPEEPAAFVAAATRAMQESVTSRPESVAVAAPREHSDFTQRAAAADVPSTIPVAPAPTAIEPARADLAAGGEPSLPAAPPAWPAETAATPAAWNTAPASPSQPATPSGLPAAPAPAPAPAPAATAQRTVLEPAPTASATPWLSGTSAAAAGAQAAASQPSPTTAAPKTEKPSATDSFFAALKKPFTMFSSAKEPADTKKPAADARPADAVAAKSNDPYGTMPLGLEGYCPVSLAEKGAWVEGRAQWGARHRGRTYLFAGPEQQQAFLADPDRYAPALSGDDPVLACDTGKQIAGQRRYGVTYQARTYLFSSPETRTAFAANPQRYTTRVKLAEGPAPTGPILR